MKKQKLNNLALNKTSISNLQRSMISGGGTDDYLTITREDDHTCNKDCNLLSQRGRCGVPNATEAYNCTVDSVAMSNCALTQCQSATACA
ncbi:hypothetical protein [uncultured Kordia sp.]|uniref:hypothetical protein n=1 Tax=uncultured Kordia sp. TaxID=507699 RepID=UPI002611C669|nr:hypothetical protein [uncultured Kordia sp.]